MTMVTNSLNHNNIFGLTLFASIATLLSLIHRDRMYYPLTAFLLLILILFYHEIDDCVNNISGLIFQQG